MSISRRAYRFWEIVPGAISWGIIVAPFLLSAYLPAGMAYFIIIFDSFWLIKAMVMGTHLVSGMMHLKRSIRIDWLARLKATEHLETYENQLRHEVSLNWGWEANKLREELQAVNNIRALPAAMKDWRQIYHVELLAVYKESETVLRQSIEGALQSNYPMDKVFLVFAVEERAGSEQAAMVEKLAKEYEGVFAGSLVYVHPDGIVGELKAKGANVTWALRQFKDYLDEKNIALDDVIVSIFDADTIPNPEYYPCLTYQYIMTPERLRRSYQPVPVFNNNIWDVPAWNRLTAFSSSFWQMIETTRPHHMVTFSSQALSMQTLVDVDYLDVAVVSEDSKQFYRAYYHYLGNYRVVPLPIPVSMDAVLHEKGYWATLKAQYIQKRRWAFGIEHFPYLMEKFFAMRKKMSLYQRIINPWRVLEGHISWSTSSLLILLGGWLPILLNQEFRGTVLAFNLPILARNLLSFTWVGVVISASIALLLLPPRPAHHKWWHRLLSIGEWVLVPVSGILFGSIPALDAETRLMFGKYLGFKVTDKHRKGGGVANVAELSLAKK